MSQIMRGEKSINNYKNTSIWVYVYIVCHTLLCIIYTKRNTHSVSVLCVRACVRACVYVCVCVCMCVCVCVCQRGMHAFVYVLVFILFYFYQLGFISRHL